MSRAYQYLRVDLFLYTKLILKPKFMFLKMYAYVKKSQLSESDIKLTIKSTGNSIFRVKVDH